MKKLHTPEPEPLLTPREVAAIWHVDPKTVVRWANQGKLTTLRTPGNHRRFLAGEVQALLNAGRQAGAR